MARGHAAAAIGKISAPRHVAIEMRSPVQEHLKGFAIANRQHPDVECAQAGSSKGKTVAICGAGPTLRSAQIGAEVDEVWGCNSALTYLASKGRRVTAGISIDQTELMLRDWAEPPDVPLYVASTCHPKLIAYLRAKGRRLLFFHNYVGWGDPLDAQKAHDDEFGYFCREWPSAIFIGQGATVVSRAILVAEMLGFERVDVYGADCCFGPDDVAHANGETIQEAYGNPIVMEGKEYGRTFRTRPDMLLDAVTLARMAQKSHGKIRLMGDTLPVALLGKPDEYLDRVSMRLAPGELPPDLKVI